MEGKYLRIKVRLAGPANKTEVDPEEDEDRWDVQTSRFRRYLRGELQEMVQAWQTDEVEIMISSHLLDDVFIGKILKHSNTFLLLSFLFLMLYMYTYTRSLFLMVIVALIMALCFMPCTQSFVQHLGHVRFDFHVNLLLFFIDEIVTVANCMMFVDCWRMSSKICPPTSIAQAQAIKINRMHFTLKWSGMQIAYVNSSILIIFLVTFFITDTVAF